MITKIYSTISIFQKEIIVAFLETINMLFTALAISFVVGLILGYLLFIFRKDGIYKNKYIYTLISALINIVRSIPFILFIIVMIPINRFLIKTGFGVNASKIPLAIIGSATFARFVEQDFLDVNKNIYETAYALGASKYQYFKDFLLKEAQSSLVLSFTSTTISLLSYSTVMGIIGGGGLGYLAIAEGYQNFNYVLMWIIIVMMILLVQLVQIIGNKIAHKLDKR